MIDTVYLSPHLDDAAFSCGGQIAEQTAVDRRVLIVTVMAGEPPRSSLTGFATTLHERWQLHQDVVTARRAEDLAACRILGADCQHWAVPDCIYRLHPETGAALYPDWAHVTAGIHPAEADLPAQLARQLASLPAAARIFAPLGIGNHVDHQIVRRAAEICFGTKLHYYEDFPYIQAPAALAAVISEDSREWAAERIPLSPAGIRTKIEAFAAFASQVSSFFVDRDDLEAQIERFAAKTGGERVWHRQIA